MNTSDVMGDLRVDDLKKLARRVDVPKKITRKAELIDELARFVTTRSQDFLQLLSDSERSALAESVHNPGGRASPTTFAAKYKVPFPSGSYGNPSLINLVLARPDWRDDPDYQVAEDAREQLKRLLDAPRRPAVTTIREVPASHVVSTWRNEVERPIQCYEGERTVFQELKRVLTLVRSGKLQVSEKARRPTSATERLVANSLAGPDFDLELSEAEREEWTNTAGPVRAHAWPVLLQQCGWCRRKQSKLELTRKGTRLLQDFSLEAFREGIERFVQDDTFDELNRIPNIKGQNGRRARRSLTPPSARREAVWCAMTEWPVGEWMTFEEAWRLVYALGHDPTVSVDSWALYFGEQRYGSIDDSRGLSRQYGRALIMESLATLGVLDIAYIAPHYCWPDLKDHWGIDDMAFCGRYDGLLYVRLNALGAFCQDLLPSYKPPAPKKRRLFTVLANREIAVCQSGALPSADRSMLEQCAVPVSDQVWRIDEDRLLRYLETGDLDDVVGYLMDNSVEPLPHPVEVFLSDVRRKLNAVVGMEDAILIELCDAQAAALIASDTRLRKLCERAGEKCVVVRKKNERTFRTALRKLGYVLPQ